MHIGKKIKCSYMVKSIDNEKLERVGWKSSLEKRQAALIGDGDWECIPESDGFGGKLCLYDSVEQKGTWNWWGCPRRGLSGIETRESIGMATMVCWIL